MSLSYIWFYHLHDISICIGCMDLLKSCVCGYPMYDAKGIKSGKYNRQCRSNLCILGICSNQNHILYAIIGMERKQSLDNSTGIHMYKYKSEVV